MSYLDAALGAMGGAMRAYGGVKQAPPQQGVQRRDEGPLMNYLRKRVHPPPTGQMPEGTEPGLPQGGMPPPGPMSPMAAPPMNPYQNPYPQRPPMVDQPPGMGMPAGGQQFAQGGIVDKPTTAIIGEDGPEMVVPLSGRPDAKVSPRNIPQMNYGR